ncbi:Hypothetical protein, putative [Bodo saltans]|uniref:Uncharacterized protein n=1 Tax=Bodo saltans TaxID=75058 RepID=A0A0S4IX74_BODSA|nr:Hypothetical protein, putative [Bodo saltans]|eukprot:CUG06227.1 Hypothetical protein, putative [Bodo saltans]
MGTMLCTCQFEPPALRSRKDRRRTSSLPSQSRSVGTTESSRLLPAAVTQSTLLMPTATIHVVANEDTRSYDPNPLALPPHAFLAMEVDAALFEPGSGHSEFSSNTTLHGRFPSLEIPPMMRAELLLAASRQEAADGPVWNTSANSETPTTPQARDNAARGGQDCAIIGGVEATPNHNFLGIAGPATVVNGPTVVVGGLLTPKQRLSGDKTSRTSSHCSPPPPVAASALLGATLPLAASTTNASPKFLRATEANTDTLVFSVGSPPLAQRMNSTDTSSLAEYKQSPFAAPPPAAPLGVIVNRQEPMSLVASFRHRMIARATSTMSSTHMEVDSFRTAVDTPSCFSGTAAMVGARPSSEAGLHTRNPMEAPSRTMSVASFASPNAHSTMSSRAYSPRGDSPLFEQIASPVQQLQHAISEV